MSRKKTGGGSPAASRPPVTIVNVGYRSTNYYVISAGRHRLLLDAGYPGTFGYLQRQLARKDIPLEEIRYVLATHYHIDHAGAVEDLKRAGVRPLLVDVQVDAVPLMKQWTKSADNYSEITLDGVRIIRCEASRAVLAEIGIGGAIVHTPGHSDDSVSLLLDDGSAFTGDLTRPQFIAADDPAVVAASWDRLRRGGARRIYPGHGLAYPLS